MNRATRKANLRKLQLPATSQENLRNEKSSTKISNYFSTSNATKSTEQLEEEPVRHVISEYPNVDEKSAPLLSDAEKPSTSNACDKDADENVAVPPPLVPTDVAKPSPKRPKRTKLTAFVCKDPAFSSLKRSRNSDVFYNLEQKKIKKAPKPAKAAKTTRPKRQQKIESLFLRNEKLFAEITAQHCLADSVSPEEMQLALAMSQSEAEMNGSLIVDSPKDEVVDLVNVANAKCNGQFSTATDSCIRSKLQQYGFRTNAGKDYSAFAAAFLNTGNRRARSKWGNRFTALTLRNREIQEKILNEKITQFLGQQFRTRSPQPTVDDADTFMFQTEWMEMSVPPFDCKIIREHDSRSLEDFFVKELFPVSRIEAGHLLKKWSAIQGRDVSPRRDSQRIRDHQKLLMRLYNDLEEHFRTGGRKTDVSDGVNAERAEGGEMPTPVLNEADNVQRAVPTSPQVSTCESIENMPSESPVAALRRSNDNAMKPAPEPEPEPVQNPMSQIILHPSPAIDSSANDARETSTVNVSDILKLCADNSTKTIITSTRAISPDIFADSDEEMVDVNAKNDEAAGEEASSSKEWTHDITTYEKYSSDDVKTSSIIEAIQTIKVPECDTVQEVIDLTQDDEASPEEMHKTPLKTTISLIDEYRPTAMSSPSKEWVIAAESLKKCKSAEKRPSASDHKTLPRSHSCSTLKRDSFRRKAATEEESLSSHLMSSGTDLTQTDDLDDFVMLSDDEINYSIRKADKRHGQENEDDFMWISDSDDDLTGSDSQRPTALLDVAPQEWPDDETACDRGPTAAIDSSPEPAMFYDNDDYQFDAVVHTPKTTSDRRSIALASCSKDVEKFHWDRSEFGILESCSEPFTQSPLALPKTLDDSFQLTPTLGESSAPLRVFSKRRSAQKFSALLETLRSEGEIGAEAASNGASLDAPTVGPQQDNPLDFNFDDFDEFDKLVMGSPEEKRAVNRTPTGFDLLLTAELSFPDGPSDGYQSPRKLFWSPSKKKQKSAVSLSPASASASASKPSPSPSPSPLKYAKDRSEELTIDGKTYIVRITDSPKPDFASMPECEQLKRLHLLGIKPLKGKKAVRMLEFVYNQTHPIMVRDDAAAEMENESDEIAPSGICRLQEAEEMDKDRLEGTASGGANTKCKKSFNFHDVPGDRQLLHRSNQGLSAECHGEEYIFQTNVSKKVSQALLPLHVAWYNLVSSHPELYESILMYEPVDLQEIYLFFKSIGYRYDPKDMKKFLDSRGIIFRYDLTGGDDEAARNRHVRKGAKRKNLNTASQQKS